jgi:hypothetical protein
MLPVPVSGGAAAGGAAHGAAAMKQSPNVTARAPAEATVGTAAKLPPHDHGTPAHAAATAVPEHGITAADAA